MKILLSSHVFAPSCGGTEQVSEALAREFVAAGHAVTVVTETGEDEGEVFRFAVVRRPGLRQLWKLIRWSDVVFHNSISLGGAWPLLFLGRPWVIGHQTWLRQPGGRRGWREWLKQKLARAAANVAISAAVQRELEAPSVVIGNPYRDDLFFPRDGILRDRELVYVGRLVSDKGVDLLLEAVAHLQTRGLRPRLMVIGSGPEEAALRRAAEVGGVAAQVTFAGRITGEALAAELHRHRIMVVPSRWREPFGIVALEGLACGCVVVAADGGGLPEAVGEAGRIFPRNEAGALAAVLEEMLAPGADLAPYLRAAPDHLARFAAGTVARQYLRLIAAEAQRERVTAGSPGSMPAARNGEGR